MKKRHRRSALETFDGCPYRFDVLYNICRNCGHRQLHHHAEPHGHCDGEGNGCLCEGFEHIEDRGDESQRGIAFHEVAFRYIDRLAKANVSADAEEASLAFREGIALAQVPGHLISQVAKLWRPFAESFVLDLDAYFAAEEQQVSYFCLNCSWRGPEADVVWKGSGSPTDPAIECCPKCSGPVSGFTWIPDLVYVRPSGIEIKDWKTYYKGLTETQALSEFQLKFYLWQAMHLWPNFPSYTFSFVFVRLRFEVSITLTPEDIEKFADEVKAITLAIYEAQRTKNYPAIPGSHCGLCRLKCPIADNKYRMPVRITGIEERDAVARQVLVKEQELRQLKKLLKGYCESEGGFIVSGEVFAFWPEVERRYPAELTLEFLQKRGIDISAITLSASALGEHANPKKASVAVTERLDQLKIEKQGWTFRHRKVGEALPPGMQDLLAEGGTDEA